MSQAYNKLSSNSEKAKRYYISATKYYDARQYREAISEFKYAIYYDNNFIEPYIMLGYVFNDMAHSNKRNLQILNDSAIYYIKKGVQLNKDFIPSAIYTLANIELENGYYQQAKEHYNEYLLSYKIPDNQISDIKTKIQKCEFAIKLLNNPVPFEPYNLGNNVNSNYNE